jgi:putative flippase GtrA
VKHVIAFRVARFALAGILNTAVNFVILNLAFYGLHQGKLASSFIATSCAVAFSFVLNRNFVFVDKERPAKKLALFLIVTISGVLVIQNSVYALGIELLHHHELAISDIAYGLTHVRLSRDFIAINLSNVIASLAVMIWNYNGYRIFVFHGERHGDDVIETEAT